MNSVTGSSAFPCRAIPGPPIGACCSNGYQITYVCWRCGFPSWSTECSRRSRPFIVRPSCHKSTRFPAPWSKQQEPPGDSTPRTNRLLLLLNCLIPHCRMAQDGIDTAHGFIGEAKEKLQKVEPMRPLNGAEELRLMLRSAHLERCMSLFAKQVRNCRLSS